MIDQITLKIDELKQNYKMQGDQIQEHKDKKQVLVSHLNEIDKNLDELEEILSKRKGLDKTIEINWLEIKGWNTNDDEIISEKNELKNKAPEFYEIVNNLVDKKIEIENQISDIEGKILNTEKRMKDVLDIISKKEWEKLKAAKEISASDDQRGSIEHTKEEMNNSILNKIILMRKDIKEDEETLFKGKDDEKNERINNIKSLNKNAQLKEAFKIIESKFTGHKESGSKEIKEEENIQESPVEEIKAPEIIKKQENPRPFRPLPPIPGRASAITLQFNQKQTQEIQEKQVQEKMDPWARIIKAEAGTYRNNCALHCIVHTLFSLEEMQIRELFKQHPIYTEILINFYDYYNLDGDVDVDDFIEILNKFSHPADREILMGQVLRRVLNLKLDTFVEDDLLIPDQSIGKFANQMDIDMVIHAEKGSSAKDLTFAINNPSWKLHIFHTTFGEEYYDFSYPELIMNKIHNHQYFDKQEYHQQTLLRDITEIVPGITAQKEVIQKVVQEQYYDLLKRKNGGMRNHQV